MSSVDKNSDLSLNQITEIKQALDAKSILVPTPLATGKLVSQSDANLVMVMTMGSFKRQYQMTFDHVVVSTDGKSFVGVLVNCSDQPNFIRSTGKWVKGEIV